MLKTAIALVAVLGLGYFLNPSAERHRASIKSSIAASSPLAATLGLGSATAFVSTYRSLGVASYTTLGERTVSVGAFGVVFVLE